jgi:hypothetical protein
MSTVAEKKTYTPPSTALDAILPIFFHSDRTIAKNISSPIHSAAAVLLCLLANAEDKGGLHQVEMKMGLRFAFDREDSNRIAAAGIEKVMKTGLVETYAEKKTGDTMYRLTAAGKEMMMNTVVLCSRMAD